MYSNSSHTNLKGNEISFIVDMYFTCKPAWSLATLDNGFCNCYASSMYAYQQKALNTVRIVWHLACDLTAKEGRLPRSHTLGLNDHDAIKETNTAFK